MTNSESPEVGNVSRTSRLSRRENARSSVSIWFAFNVPSTRRNLLDNRGKFHAIDSRVRISAYCNFPAAAGRRDTARARARARVYIEFN